MRDPLVRRVTVAVQDVLAAESERRAASGEPALTTTAQQALAIKTVHAELATLDQDRLRDGQPRLTRADEDRRENEPRTEPRECERREEGSRNERAAEPCDPAAHFLGRNSGLDSRDSQRTLQLSR